MAFHKLVVPTINVNDDKVTLGGVEKENLEFVDKGETLCSFETSKSTEDFHSEFEGYVVWLAEAYDEIKVGKDFCIIFETKEEAEAKLNNKESEKPALPADFKASNKAIEYAASIGFDIKLIKKDGIVKTEDIDAYLNANKKTTAEDNINAGVCFEYYSTPKRVAIIGAGRGAMQVLDLISHINGYEAVALFDDAEHLIRTSVYGVMVVGKIDFDDISKSYNTGSFDYIVNGIGGSCDLRKKCFDELTKRGVPYCNLIHPSVIIGSYVKMGVGNILMPMTHIGPNAEIGNDCFMTAKTSIEHHNIVGSHCSFGPGVLMSGSVTIGNCTKFGAGIFVEPLVKIGSNCLIASGAILTNHIPDNSILRCSYNQEIVPNKKSL